METGKSYLWILGLKKQNGMWFFIIRRLEGVIVAVIISFCFFPLLEWRGNSINSVIKPSPKVHSKHILESLFRNVEYLHIKFRLIPWFAWCVFVKRTSLLPIQLIEHLYFFTFNQMNTVCLDWKGDYCFTEREGWKKWSIIMAPLADSFKKKNVFDWMKLCKYMCLIDRDGIIWFFLMNLWKHEFNLKSIAF